MRGAPKSMQKSNKRNTEQAAIVQKTAKLMGVSKRYVRMVVNGERKNEGVMTCYMEILERDNALLNAVKELIPFK